VIRCGYISLRALGVMSVALAAAAVAVVAVSLYRGAREPASTTQPANRLTVRGAPSPAAGDIRIVSLAPAVTDMLFKISAGDKVVAISRWCPEGIDRPRVGDQQSVSVEQVLGLDPDVILVQQDMTPRLRKLADAGIRVMDCRINTLGDVLSLLPRLGELTGSPAADRMLAEIRSTLADVRERVPGRDRPRVLLTINDEPRAVAPGTFLDELIAIAGGENVIDFGHGGYPILNRELIIRLAPEVIIDIVASPRPLDRNAPVMIERRSKWQRMGGVPAVENGRVYVVQDRLITIPGTHIGETARKLARFIHPRAFVDELPLE
jgi:iron complex transport system substrate-binding protein